MYVIDTNVVSELIRAEPTPTVATWIAMRDLREIYLTSINEAELRYGIAIMPIGKRRNGLELSLSRWLELGFKERILPFESSASQAYAKIAADRRRVGRSINEMDCQIAAICHAHSATLITRNVRDFEDTGIEIVDPWEPFEK